MAAETEGLRLPLYCPLVVDGEEGKAASGRQFARENPANVREVATVAEEGTQEDARAAIDAARAAFDSNAGNWIYNGKLREQVLSRTARLVRDSADRLARVVSLEVGMPMRQATPHIAAAADIFEFYAGLAGKLYGESFTLPSGSTINLVKEPVGVVGVIKPASYTPAATYELVKLILQTGLPKGVLNLVPGPGAVVGSVIIASKKVDKISFTGET